AESIGKAYAASTISGISTGLLGYGIGKIGFGDVEAGVASKFGKSFLSKKAFGGLGEALEELPQSAQEAAWNNWAMDRPIGEGVAKAATAGALTGFAAGGALASGKVAKPTITDEDMVSEDTTKVEAFVDDFVGDVATDVEAPRSELPIVPQSVRDKRTAAIARQAEAKVQAKEQKEFEAKVQEAQAKKEAGEATEQETTDIINGLVADKVKAEATRRANAESLEANTTGKPSTAEESAAAFIPEVGQDFTVDDDTVTPTSEVAVETTKP
ncbi:unnamed protein product, partial [marine sediment metagenome]